MESYEIRRVKSGFEEGYAWLSIWYRAEPRKLDVLHLVVAPPDERHGLGPVYLEGRDQAIACYDGAKSILVGNRSLEIRLNARGARALLLAPALTLVAPEKTTGWKKATEWLRVAAGEPSGGVIRMV